MLEPIHGRYRWTEAEFVAHYRAACRSMRRFEAASPWQRRIRLFCWPFALIGLAPILFFVVIIVPILWWHNPRALVQPVAILAALLLIAYAAVHTRRLAPYKVFRQIPERLRDVEWWVDDQGIRKRTELTEIHRSWDLVQRVEEIPSAFLFFEDQNQVEFFPKASLDDSAEVSRFRSLCKAKGKLTGELMPAPNLEEL